MSAWSFLRFFNCSSESTVEKRVRLGAPDCFGAAAKFRLTIFALRKGGGGQQYGTFQSDIPTLKILRALEDALHCKGTKDVHFPQNVPVPPSRTSGAPHASANKN